MRAEIGDSAENGAPRLDETDTMTTAAQPLRLGAFGEPLAFAFHALPAGDLTLAG
jgi:hypothetical protein